MDLFSPEFLTTLCCFQGWNALQEMAFRLGKKKIPKPPCGAETRWAGLLPMLAWVNEHKMFLVEYIAPQDCVVNPDGSAYSSHRIEEFEWLDIIQLVSCCVINVHELKSLLTCLLSSGCCLETHGSLHCHTRGNTNCNNFSRPTNGWAPSQGTKSGSQIDHLRL